MPTVKCWADDLREAFGAVEFDAGLRSHGFLACEGGKTVDTRKLKPTVLVTPVLPLRKKESARGR